MQATAEKLQVKRRISEWIEIGSLGKGLDPVGLHDLGHLVVPWCQVLEQVAPIGRRGRAGFTIIERSVVVGIQEDCPACQAFLARVLLPIGVAIVVLDAADLAVENELHRPNVR